MTLQSRPTVQDPSYLTRQSMQLNLGAAANGQSNPKFVAHANLLLFSLTSTLVGAGTSTYTKTVNGTGTTIINAQTIALIVISNANAFTTSSVSLSTATYGPYVMGGTFGTGTLTAQVGAPDQFVLNTTTGTQGYGGVFVPQGSLIYAVAGTDATATEMVVVDYQINTGAGLTV